MVAHVAHNTGNNEWYSPPELMSLVREVLGTIDLDPASCELANQTVRAEVFFTVNDHSLSREWHGKVFLNPPYSKSLINLFARKLLEEYESGRVTEAIVLVNNATETKWGQALLNKSAGVCFPNHRIRFLSPEGTKGSPLQAQMLLYFGPNPEYFKDVFSQLGTVKATSMDNRLYMDQDSQLYVIKDGKVIWVYFDADGYVKYLDPPQPDIPNGNG